MKHIVIAIAFILCAGFANAQSNRSGTFNQVTAAGTVKNIGSNDTLSGADTAYLWNGRNDHNQWSTVALKYVVTQLTGTTTCTMIVQGSNDATSATSGNWTTLENYVEGSVGLVDTGTVKNTTYQFLIPNCNFKYLRVRAITSGTQTSILSGSYYLAAKYVGLLN